MAMVGPAVYRIDCSTNLGRCARSSLVISPIPGLIPAPLRTDRSGPVEGAEGADAAGVIEESVLGVATGVDDGVVARPETMREEALAQVEPDPFDGVELGRI